MKKLAALVSLLTLCTVVPANAVTTGRLDPDDVGGRLDIAKIQIEKATAQSTTGTLSLQTHESWRCRKLRRGTAHRLIWYFDDTGDDKADFVGRIICSDGRLAIFLRTADGSSQYEPIPVNRPNKRTARFSMNFALIMTGVDVFAWARSKDASCSTPCLDRAPDTGGLKLY